jgi:hypothetical protein
MKKLNQILLFSSVALALVLSTALVRGQPGAGNGGANYGGNRGGANYGGGGNFNNGGGRQGFDMSQVISQFIPQLAAGFRQQLSVTNDDDWNAIEPRLEKAVKLKIEVLLSGLDALPSALGASGGGMGGMGGMGVMGMMSMMGIGNGMTDPTLDALQQALDGNAPAAEVKAAMAKVRDSRQQKRAELAKAQQDLKDILTTRQEAKLLRLGVID